MKSATAALRDALQHPGLLALLFIVRSFIAVTAAWLLMDAFSPAWVMGLPRRDESIFEPGLALLLRLCSENRQQWSHWGAVSIWIAVVAAVVGAVAVVFVLFSLQFDTRQPLRLTLRKTIHSVPRQLGIVSVYWLAVILTVYVVRQLSGFLPAMIYPWLGEKGADAMLLCLVAVLAATVVGLRIACDLARVGATRSDQPVAAISATAMRALCSRWRFWLGTYACFAIPSVALPVVIEIWIPTFTHSTRFGLVPTLVHQGAVLVTCLLQLSWWVLVQTHASLPAGNN
jgi:uncharacterized membrane protein